MPNPLKLDHCAGWQVDSRMHSFNTQEGAREHFPSFSFFSKRNVNFISLWLVRSTQLASSPKAFVDEEVGLSTFTLENVGEKRESEHSLPKVVRRPSDRIPA